MKTEREIWSTPAICNHFFIHFDNEKLTNNVIKYDIQITSDKKQIKITFERDLQGEVEIILCKMLRDFERDLIIENINAANTSSYSNRYIGVKIESINYSQDYSIQGIATIDVVFSFLTVKDN